jgi:tetratricopeptide (TPR) repeat protein
MSAVLKAMGLTLWGLIAFGLLTVFLFVGYQAAIRFRNPSHPVADTRDMNGQSDGSLTEPPRLGSPEIKTPPDGKTPSSDLNSTNLAAMQKLLRSAADEHRHEAAIGYGRTIYDSGLAGPDDLQIIAQTYFSIDDCINALIWADRANEAFRAAGREIDESLHQIKRRCESSANHRVTIDPNHLERVTRLLNSFKERAEMDRKSLPQLAAEAENNKSGELDVKLGELYFGFGDYNRAISAIQRGLEKGQVKHLDDAYVYLGRSQVAVDNIVEARKAFAKLRNVPNIDPRVLRLWELYAETLE